MEHSENYDLIIAGGGLAGLTSASVFLREGFKIALVAPKSEISDGRSTAFLKHSIDYLTENQIWPQVEDASAPMSVMRIIDSTDRILRSPEIAFRSTEIGEKVFGFNILNSKYSELLGANLATQKNFTHINDTIDSLTETDTGVKVLTKIGVSLNSKILIAADGRNSTCRDFANGGKGIGTRQWSYPQQAIVLNFKHTLPHHNASNEFHRKSGPFTQVPLSEGQSSLVWVETPEKADEILALDKVRQEDLIEIHLQSILGKVEITTNPQSFPLSGLSAEKFAQGRIFLVGDAGHCMPPIGAQGFNLGIRDIECLQKLLKKNALDEHSLAEKYHRSRRNDIASRLRGVDLLNRSLLSDFLPAQLARTGSMQVLKHFSSIRRLAIHEGLSPGHGLRKIFEKRAV